MAKISMKPGNMVYPVPAAIISVAGRDGKSNLITAAWTGTINSDPAMAYVSIRPERFSHHMIEETGEFVINLTTRSLVRETDLCGVTSGRDVNKWKLTGLSPMRSQVVNVPIIKECPVNIECRVTEVKRLGSHDCFLAEVVAINASEEYFDEKGRFNLEKADLIAYSHGAYYALGEKLGTFGYSIRKKP
ncbi:MAG: flavin reductase family protein [Eubacteriales bacterium]|nr:flavin reductase family protein [Eubacteriales bacterium]